MPFKIPINQAQKDFPEYKFIKPLTESEQKAAFHIQNEFGEDLCLKIIAPNYSLDRLEREINAMQLINHPNVAKLKEYTFTSTPTKQRHFMIEEFIMGDDLSTLLTPGNIWQRKKVASFFIELCDGLNALFGAKIVHRDFKPSNIRVRPNGSPVIIDFGWARLLDKIDLTTTSEGAAFGTPIYFAPEQFNGTKKDIDHRTDIFAFGILIYQALTGKHIFNWQKMSFQQLSDAICFSTEYLDKAEFRVLPKEWQLLVSKLLEKERSKRIQNPAQIKFILQKIGAI